jgi:Transglutaminase-like superfamily
MSSRSVGTTASPGDLRRDEMTIAADESIAGAAHRITATRVLAETALAAAIAAATFLAVLPWLRAYRVPGAGVFVAAASVVPVVIASLAIRLWHKPVSVSYAASLVGLVLVMFAGAGPHPVGIVRDFVQGPNHLLTQTLPLGGSRAGLSAVIVMTWLCGAVTAELSMRAIASRSGLERAALLVPVAVYVLAYAMSASSPDRTEVGGPLLLAILVCAAVARHQQLQRSTEVAGDVEERVPVGLAGYRAALTGAGVAGAVIVATSVLVAGAPSMSRGPASLREAAPTTVRLVVDPVDAMASLRDSNPRSSPRLLMTLRTGKPTTGYLAIAILDSYDGDFWQFASTFEPTGGRIPSIGAFNQRFVASSAVPQRITLDARLPVPLLPMIDRPESVSGVAVAADPLTGMVLPDKVRPTLSYVASSLAPDLTLIGLPSADGVVTAASAATDGVPQSDLLLPPNSSAAMAATMRFMASLTAPARPAPTVAYLQTLLSVLHSKERWSNPVLSSGPISATRSKRTSAANNGGTSLSQVINAVTVDRSATPEQFATVFAMVARYLGVPSRVVTGFRVGPSSEAQVVDAGSYGVTSRQAWTWAEIAVSGVGWVVADPTPDAAVRPGTAAPEQASTSPTSVPPRAANAVPRGSAASGHPLAKPSPPSLSREAGVPAWLIAVAAVTGLLLIAGLAGPGQAAIRRSRRRRARRTADPTELAVGAWLELLDGLEQSGMETPRSATGSEIAVDAGRYFGPEVVEPIAAVGALADRAMHSISDPPDEVSAREAWDSQAALTQRIRDSLELRARGRALLSVGTNPPRPVAQRQS